VSQAVNDGTESVSVDITSTVYSPKGEVVNTFSGTNDASANSSAIVTGRFTIDAPEQGEYRVVMNVAYDGKTAADEKTIVLAQAQASGGQNIVQNIVPTTIGTATGGSIIIYVLAAAVLVLAVYILLKRKK